MPGSNDRGTAVGFRNNLNLKTVGVPYSIVSSKNRNVVGGLFDTLLGCSWWRFGLVLGSAIVICQSGQGQGVKNGSKSSRQEHHRC
jgi:hypothetical protein